MSEKIRRIDIVVASDMHIFLEGLSMTLARYEEINVLDTASSSEEAVHLCRLKAPDVLLLDSRIDLALCTVERVTSLDCDTKVVALGISLCQKQISTFADAGARQFLTREDSLFDLRRCIDAATEGGFWCSTKLSKTLLGSLSNTGVERFSGPSTDLLTNRQCKILELVDCGKTNKEIARTLNIEAATVKNHVYQILKKLSARNRTEAAAIFRRISQSEDKVVSLY